MSKQYISCLVALGSNLMVDKFSSLDIVNQAIVNLNARGAMILAISRYYRTPSFPKNSGPDFVNCALMIRSVLQPSELLELFHSVEHDLGRVRNKRWGARVVDIDLLSYGSEILPDRSVYDHWKNLSLEEQMRQAPEELIVPHPRIQDRGFVLGPLLDIAPNWRHPVSGATVKDMWSALSEQERDEVFEI